MLEELVTAAESTPLVGADTAPQHGQTDASGVAPAQSVSSQFTGAQATSPHPSEAPAVPRPGHSERASGHSFSFVERQLQIPNAEGSSTSGASYVGFEQAGSLFPPASGFSLLQSPLPRAPDDGMDSHAIIGDGAGPNLDFAFMDDTLSMWTNAPSSFR